jgi:predicted ArsR family transcriptional regulator
MKSTRKRIMDYLKSQRVATTAEIGRALQVTEADVRHHLTVLRAENQVEVSGERRKEGRGRPAQVFSLTPQARGDNFMSLAAAFMDEARQSLSDEERQDTLKRIARHLSGGPASADNLAQRLYQATQRLNELSYQARWEAHADGPQLIFAHCPYAAILADHPELCQLDSYLIEQLVASPATQTAKLERDARGASFCKFSLKV